MFCPRCRAEYVAYVKSCAHCEVALVVELPPESDLASAESMAERLRDRELEAIAAGVHGELQRMQRRMADEGIASVIGAEDSPAESAMVAQRFELLVAVEDASRARNFLHEAFADVVRREGIASGKAGDNEAGEACPACGAALSSEPECPDCGLFLGEA